MPLNGLRRTRMGRGIRKAWNAYKTYAKKSIAEDRQKRVNKHFNDAATALGRGSAQHRAYLKSLDK